MFSAEQIKTLNELELSVYQFVIQNSEKVQYMKIRELAQEAHVSTTTIMRFCKKIGCEGYSEFKMTLKKAIETEKTKKLDESNLELIDCLKKISTQEWEDKLEYLCDIIIKANQVIFMGSGMSGNIAKYGARYLSSIGKFSLYIDEPHYPTNAYLSENVLVIVFSVSGESNDVIGHVNRLKSANCHIVSITNHEFSTLARMSDYNLSYYVPDLYLGIYNITTQIPAMNIVERLGRKIKNRFG